MARYKLTISYDGSAYSGWQVQGSLPSIQAHIQKALATALRHPVQLSGSGRTDAKVHAKGQTAHFDSEVSFKPDFLRLSLNALLPQDIRILKVESVSSDFHARYSAISKRYHYYLHTDRILNPFTRHFRWQIFQTIDLDAMREAAAHFLGKKDFTSFANEAFRGSASRDPVRTLTKLDIEPIEQGLCLVFEADGFLYKMVRNITGTLVACGTRKQAPQEIPHIFAKKNRSAAGATAPPQGLCLMQVFYPETLASKDNAQLPL